MDWHPVISVQQHTPDNDCYHFNIANVRFAFWAFFRKPKNSGLKPGQNDDPVTRWPGSERWPKWPIDPVTQWPSSTSAPYVYCNFASIRTIPYALCFLCTLYTLPTGHRRDTDSNPRCSTLPAWMKLAGRWLNEERDGRRTDSDSPAVRTCSRTDIELSLLAFSLHLDSRPVRDSSCISGGF